MPKLVVDGAVLECTDGTSPSKLAVVPGADADDNGSQLATVQDMVPNTNVMPFGMCTTLANPQVQAATAAAQGTLTPVPCVPVVPAPWAPGSSGAELRGLPLLTDDSTCNCQWTGTISIASSGSDTDIEI